MVEILPASIYLAHSQVVDGNNPVGQVKDTRYSSFPLDSSLADYAFPVKTVSSPLNDPAISLAPVLDDFNLNSPIFSEAVTSLYDKQNNYGEGIHTGSRLDIIG